MHPESWWVKPEGLFLECSVVEATEVEVHMAT